MTFSIIIPVYNVAPYLRECLDSILAQTYADWEAICVDDGSTDGSGKILAEYASKDSRFRTVHQQNQGVSVARNRAMSMAVGEWLLFMDPDDYYPSQDIFSHFIDAIESSGSSIVGGGFRTVAEDSSLSHEKVISNVVFEKVGHIRYSESQQQLGFTRYAYKTKLIRDNSISFPLITKWEDPPFLVNALFAAQSFYAIPEVVYSYRQRRGSARHEGSINVGGIKEALSGLSLVFDVAEKGQLRQLAGSVVQFITQSDTLKTVEELCAVKGNLMALIRRIRGSRLVNVCDWERLIDSGFLQSVKPLCYKWFLCIEVLGLVIVVRVIMNKAARRVCSYV